MVTLGRSAPGMEPRGEAAAAAVGEGVGGAERVTLGTERELHKAHHKRLKLAAFFD